MQLPFKVFIISLMLAMPMRALSFQGENDILGKWISTKKNVVIEVYKIGNQFKAKVLWFRDLDDPSRPMKTRKDINNPDKALRNQLILGMDVLEGLQYNADKHRWEDGKIYDASSGRHWSSVVYFNKQNQLEVKGYWKFEFIGQSLTFTRFKP